MAAYPSVSETKFSLFESLIDDCHWEIFAHLGIKDRNSLRRVSRQMNALCVRMKKRRYEGREDLNITLEENSDAGRVYLSVSFGGESVSASHSYNNWISANYTHSANYTLSRKISDALLRLCTADSPVTHVTLTTEPCMLSGTCTYPMKLTPFLLRIFSYLPHLRSLTIINVEFTSDSYTRCPPIHQPVDIHIDNTHIDAHIGPWYRVFRNATLYCVDCMLEDILPHGFSIDRAVVTFVSGWRDVREMFEYNTQLFASISRLDVRIENTDARGVLIGIKNMRNLRVVYMEVYDRKHTWPSTQKLLQELRCEKLVLRAMWDRYRVYEEESEAGLSAAHLKAVRSSNKWVRERNGLFSALLAATGADESE